MSGEVVEAAKHATPTESLPEGTEALRQAFAGICPPSAAEASKGCLCEKMLVIRLTFQGLA